jgi:hypothetical protein
VTTIRLAYGYQSWTTAIHLQRALSRIVTLEVEGSGHPAEAGTTDRSTPVLWIESGIAWVPSPADLESAMSGAYLIDTHRGFRWRAALANAFDCVFTAQLPAAQHLKGRGAAAEWLPLAAPRELCAPGPDLADRPYDVAFVGQAPPGSFRATLLEALKQATNVAPVTGRLEPAEMMDVYRSARVVINVPINDDLNMRAFEAPGARALMVTEAVPGLDAVLPPDSYVAVTKRTVDAWVDAVRRGVADPDAQRRADAAHQHVLACHTYDDRAKAVVERLATAPRRNVPPQARRRALAAAWSRWDNRAEIRALGLSPPVSLAYQAAALGWGAATRAAHLQRRRNSR